MKSINKVPSYDELYINLARLNEMAKAVAYAKSPEDAQFFTMKYLRPQIEKSEQLMDELVQNRKSA